MRFPATFLEDDRGQTLQDYVIGVSIFLVVVFLALTFFPNMLSGFQTGAVGDHEAQADRVARNIISNDSVPGTVNELNGTGVNETMRLSEQDLRNRSGLADTVNLNITVESLDGTAYVTHRPSGVNLTSEPQYYDNTAGASARIITLTHSNGCSPACRLVVRAW